MLVPSVKQILSRLRRFKLEISTVQFVVAVLILNTLLYHFPLFGFSFDNLDFFTLNGVKTFITIIVLVNLITVFVLFLLSFFLPALLKPFVILVLFCNSIALYFVHTYKVILDKSMMGNVFNTNFSESSEFLHPKLIAYIIAFGVIPAWLVLKTHIVKSAKITQLKYTFAIFIVFIGWIYFASSTWLWVDKYSKTLGGMIMPWSYAINMARVQMSGKDSIEDQEVLPDAVFTEMKPGEKMVVVLVIGETARASNFQLYGYQRKNNPLLSQTNIVALKNSKACTTYTTGSLNCILSHNNSDNIFGSQFEKLPTYLSRQGVDVIWRTNNWGEPPIKVNEYIRQEDLLKTCKGKRCRLDEVMQIDLLKRIKASDKQRILVVLHQKGSHGPSYYKRYPKEYETYKPVCRSVELNQCSQQELINAYDNTIIYNDYLLSDIINQLKQKPEINSVMLYLSDHGESLGESGLYLHGTPMSIAPDVQVDIPFLVWMSDGFMRAKNINPQDLKQQQSHGDQNVFHSVMGALGMQSDIYKAQEDIFMKTTTSE